MNPKNLSELLPPLPTLADVAQSSFADEATVAAEVAIESQSRRAEVVTLTDAEFESVLSGAAAAGPMGLSLEQTAAAVAAIAGNTGGDAPLVQGEDSSTTPAASPLDAEMLDSYVAAAALRYTFRFDALRPVRLDAQSAPLPRYEELSAEHCEAVFAHLSGRSEIVKDARGKARWALRDEERRMALKSLIEMADLPEAVTQARADAAAEQRRSAAKRSDGDKAPDAASAQSSARDGGASRVEEVLWSYLLGEAKPLEKQDSRELLISQRVTGWLHGLTSTLLVPEPDKVARQLARETLLQPFRHLTGEWKNGRFISNFKGREEELKSLYGYLKVIPPSSFHARVSAAFSSLFDTAWDFITSRPGTRPLLIHGPGGVGKSTLLAKLLLDHLTETDPSDRFPYAYLDFDLSALNVSEPMTLIAESARQLAAQYPSLRHEWEAARAEWLKAINVQEANDREEPGGDLEQQRVDALARFAEMLGRCENPEASVSEQFRRGLPFLLIMDTFEEVQYHDRDAVKKVFRFLNEFRMHVPALRAILMGRAPVKDVREEYAEIEDIAVEGDVYGTGAATDFDVIEVALGDLPGPAALAYLQEQGIDDSELAEDLIEVVGGTPLSLRLIARVLREGEIKLSSLRDEMQWRPSLSDRLLGRKIPPRALLQGVLFRRILGHIHDDRVRALAHPGLVLRRITPELIKEVLAVPCGLGTLDDAEAEEYFKALAKEVSLVGTATDPEGTLVLKHRVELRRIMLRLMEADDEKQDQIQQVHENAVLYYAKRKGQVARVEELYHRLMIGALLQEAGPSDDVPAEEAVEAGYVAAPPAAVDPRPVWRALAEAAAELPLAATLYLAARLHRELVPDAAWETANPRDWELVTLCRVSRRARAHASVVSALESLRRDVKRMPPQSLRSMMSPLPLVEAALLERLGRFTEVVTHAQRGLQGLKASYGQSETVGYYLYARRDMEYNLMAARSAARTGKGASARFLRDARIGAGKLRAGEKTAFGADVARRGQRQLLRFAADCYRLDPTPDALECITDGLRSLARMEAGLRGSPALVRYAVSVAYADASGDKLSLKFIDELLVQVTGQELLPALLSRLPKSALPRVAEALAQWLREALKSQWRNAMLAELGRPHVPGDPVMLSQYWRSQLLEHPAEAAAKLPALFELTRISPARLADLFRALTPEPRESGEDPFEEARLAGDLMPGEGPRAVEQSGKRTVRKKK